MKVHSIFDHCYPTQKAHLLEELMIIYLGRRHCEHRVHLGLRLSIACVAVDMCHSKVV